MTNPYLLVPMQLDAMVLNKDTRLSNDFLRFEMDYDNLNEFASPEPPPFEGQSTEQPDAGIYLHWTLPSALRHGVHDDAPTDPPVGTWAGSTDFPLVPNRWLVVRTQAGMAPTAATTAWLIESDYVWPADEPTPVVGNQPATAAFVSPDGLTEDGKIQPTRIGRALPLTAVEALDPSADPYLLAVGPGNVHFSAFEPGAANVLAFVDPVQNQDNTKIDEATFTYTVVGWYSDPTHDPLKNTTWKANPDPKLNGTYLNSGFPWYAYAASADLPVTMLVHATAPDVPWKRDDDNPPPPSYPSDIADTVRVSFGGTATDALSAILRLDGKSKVEADMLEAFQYGLLDTFDQPGSSEALNMAIRQHWYDASSGGTLWTIAASEQPDNPGLPTPPITSAQAATLAALNADQRKLDRQQRILASMQWTLYGLWWMHGWLAARNKQVSPPDAQGLDHVFTWLTTQLPLQIGIGSTPTDRDGRDPTREEWYAWKVNAQLNLVAHRTALVDAAVTNVTGTAPADKPANPRLQPIKNTQLVLKATNMPQYFSSQDPVVLVSNLGHATDRDPGDPLLCRLPGQTIDGLTVGGNGGGTLYTATSLAGRIPVLSDPKQLLPDGLASLYTESLFLSPVLMATAIGLGVVPPWITAAINAIGPPAIGTQFPPDASSFAPWQQPWVPLLLDWRVVVLRDPAYAAPTDQPTCTFNQDNWLFHGTHYAWNGPTQASGGNFDENDSGQMTLQGRTFVTPHIANTLAKQVDEFVSKHAFRDKSLEDMLKDLESYVDNIAKTDLLSQRLSGMLAQMVGRGSVQTVVPSGDIAKLLGNSQHGVPQPFGSAPAYGTAIWDFAPLGGTFYVITGLSVIDAFGRTIDLLGANNSTAPPTAPTQECFYPIEGRNVKAPTAQPPAPSQGPAQDATARMLQLTPAPVQPSQLRFQLISNDRANTEIDVVAGANPVCGWVIPNHLDRSLAFYEPDGSASGELSLVSSAGTSTPTWRGDPTAAAPPTLDQLNPYVQQLIAHIKAQPASGDAFADLVDVIDQSLWTINPPGDKNDHNLAVLVGRPLAIVRAEISLQLQGLPYTSQDWPNIFAPPSNNQPDPWIHPKEPAKLAAHDGGVSSFLWPIRLGSAALRNDGLIGYLVDEPNPAPDSATVFHAVTLPDRPRTDFLRLIGTGNYPKVRFVDDSVTARDPAQQQVCRLTMLVDPRGALHAFSGLLPVASLQVPSQFVTPALNTISYLFRSGPLLTVPDSVRIPRPAESKGNWDWFDKTTRAVVPITPSDANVSVATTASVIKEGWLKFTPNPAHKDVTPDTR